MLELSAELYKTGDDKQFLVLDRAATFKAVHDDLSAANKTQNLEKQAKKDREEIARLRRMIERLEGRLAQQEALAKEIEADHKRLVRLEQKVASLSYSELERL